MNIGVFSCDPGGHTGLAWAVLDPLAPVEDGLRARLNAGSTTVVGDERTQIREIVSLWQSFYRVCVRSACLPPESVWFVCEDFVMRPGETAGGRDSTSPLALIWGVEGYRMGQADQWNLDHRGKKQIMLPPMIMQMAGMASSYATKERLKSWDCWVVGREHERSAYKHMALFLSRYKQQHRM